MINPINVVWMNKRVNSWNLIHIMNVTVLHYLFFTTLFLAPGEGDGTPVLEIPPVLLPGKSHGWRSLVGWSPWGHSELDRTERLHFHFSLSCIEKEMATHSSILAWRIPGTGEPGGLLSMGSHRVGHDWSDLAAAAAVFSSCLLVSATFVVLSFLWGIFFIYPFFISSLSYSVLLCISTYRAGS